MKILLPCDGSPAALAAVRHALALAADGLAARFVLANVQEPATLYEVVRAHDAEQIAALKRDAGADLLAAAEALLLGAGAEFESQVLAGEPHHALVELAEREGCDAIVMGRRGDGAAGPSSPGSVALAVLAHSPLPVTLVAAPDDGD